MQIKESSNGWVNVLLQDQEAGAEVQVEELIKGFEKVVKILE